MNGYFCQGFNPLLSFPNREKITAALSKLKFLVIMDPLRDRDGAVLGEPRRATTTSIPRRSRPRCSSCRRPALPRRRARSSTPAAGCNGTGRAATPPGEAKSDIWIMAQLYLRLKALYEKEGGAFPDPILNLALALRGPGRADAGGARQGDQRLRRSTTCTDPADPTKVAAARRASSSPSFAQLRDDGTTACGCWIYSGCFTEAGNNMARRDNYRSRRHRRLSRTGRSRGRPTGASSTTAPRADLDGKPWDPERKLIEWNGDEVGRLRRARHRADRQAATWSARSS